MYNMMLRKLHSLVEMSLKQIYPDRRSTYREEFRKPGPILQVIGNAPLHSNGASSPPISLYLKKLKKQHYDHCYTIKHMDNIKLMIEIKFCGGVRRGTCIKSANTTLIILYKQLKICIKNCIIFDQKSLSIISFNMETSLEFGF